jgi:hypothetical protein
MQMKNYLYFEYATGRRIWITSLRHCIIVIIISSSSSGGGSSSSRTLYLVTLLVTDHIVTNARMTVMNLKEWIKKQDWYNWRHNPKICL